MAFRQATLTPALAGWRPGGALVSCASQRAGRVSQCATSGGELDRGRDRCHGALAAVDRAWPHGPAIRSRTGTASRKDALGRPWRCSSPPARCVPHVFPNRQIEGPRTPS